MDSRRRIFNPRSPSSLLLWQARFLPTMIPHDPRNAAGTGGLVLCVRFGAWYLDLFAAHCFHVPPAEPAQRCSASAGSSFAFLGVAWPSADFSWRPHCLTGV